MMLDDARPIAMPRGHSGELATSSTRLLVAAHFVRAGRVGGAEHMLYNLLRGFGGLGVDLTVACSSLRDLDQDTVDELSSHPRTRIIQAGNSRSRFVAEQLTALRPDLVSDAVLFPNYFVPPIVPRRLGRVVTVLHDLQYRHFPQYFTITKRIWLRLAHSVAMRRADRIVVISEFARNDALRWLGRRIDANLAVIPNPISWDRFDLPDDAAPPLDRPYLLSVAAQYPHKNLATLIRAFAEVARFDRDLQLVLCGQRPGALLGMGGKRLDTHGLAAELGISDRVIHMGYVGDRSLGNWYRHARGFVFPSMFEGFGMPPVEALGFGIPVLTTNRAAIPEITRGLAHYVQNPLRVSEWAASILEMTRDPDSFRISAFDCDRLRSYYAPDRIARKYMTLFAGG